MTRLAALALTLSGCATLGVPLSPVQMHAVETVRDEWRTAGLEYREGCDREELAIVVADDATMMREADYCAADGPICTETRSAPDPWLARARAGCLLGVCSAESVRWEHSAPWPAGLFTPARVVLIVTAYYDERRQLAAVAHAYAHALSMCAFGPGVGADEGHRDQRVWGPGGVVRRATERLAAP